MFKTAKPAPSASIRAELVLEPGRSEQNYWKDLWRYRELFYFLAWRDVLVRYKQMVFGVGWALIRPLLTMIILTVVFGNLAKMPSGGVPYPILVSVECCPGSLLRMLSRQAAVVWLPTQLSYRRCTSRV